MDCSRRLVSKTGRLLVAERWRGRGAWGGGGVWFGSRNDRDSTQISFVFSILCFYRAVYYRTSFYLRDARNRLDIPKAMEKLISAIKLQGFLDKNRDLMRPDILSLLKNSDSRYVRDLLGESDYREVLFTLSSSRIPLHAFLFTQLSSLLWRRLLDKWKPLLFG